MKHFFTATLLLFSAGVFAQEKGKSSPVEIFTSQRVINANTTEVTGKGKMNFKVVHNFGDIAGKFGGLKNFFGLDNNVDVRIAFEIGVGKKTDLTFARAKGASQQQKLWEVSVKHQLMQQMENDKSHPVSMALFANMVVASNKASALTNLDHSYDGFGERSSNTFQLMIARKMGKVSLQLNPTLVTRGYAMSYDQKTIFAMGGALRIPLSSRFNFIMDYFHPFKRQAVEDSFALASNGGFKFSDPLGVGLEILTGRHVFHLNFTNATEILENRFIPRTVTSWAKGQFRWGFTISRQFDLCRRKK
jgi:hypothetical protein